MRRYFLTLALMTATLAASAQNMYDAFSFSDVTYGGTARSIALGNAMTAIGGDLGSLTLNPAGSAVNSYSQFSITPNISVSSIKSKGEYGLTDETSSTHTRFNLYNTGFVLNFDNHRSSGLRNYAIGFVASSTGNYLGDIFATGRNGYTSFMGAMAAGADGFTSATLNSSDAWYGSDAPWNQILGYQSGMIATYGGRDDQYVAATEKVYSSGDIGLAGDLEQEFGRFTRGSRTDFLFNFGANFSDILYVGGNLGLVAIDYSMDQYIKEEAVNPADFGITFDDGRTTNFTSARHRYAYDAEGSGVYAKIGVILKPFAGLRFGAAIQTPTAVSIRENYQMDGYTKFSESSLNASAASPSDNEWEYRLTTPFRFNLGAAWTIGRWGFISADYERANYGSMRFNVSGDFSNRSYFDDTNADIRDFYGHSDAFRFGVEIRPTESLALRGGYAIETNPEMFENEAGYMGYYESGKKALSFGIGYSSRGSFFSDFAFRTTSLPDLYTLPYADYINDTLSPEIHSTRRLNDITVTIGWRF